MKKAAHIPHISYFNIRRIQSIQNLQQNEKNFTHSLAISTSGCVLWVVRARAARYPEFFPMVQPDQSSYRVKFHFFCRRRRFHFILEFHIFSILSSPLLFRFTLPAGYIHHHSSIHPAANVDVYMQ